MENETWEEWGGSCRFLNAKMVDSEGKEIEEPRCEICGEPKICFIGKSAYQWICNNQHKEAK